MTGCQSNAPEKLLYVKYCLELQAIWGCGNPWSPSSIKGQCLIYIYINLFSVVNACNYVTYFLLHRRRLFLFLLLFIVLLFSPLPTTSFYVFLLFLLLSLLFIVLLFSPLPTSSFYFPPPLATSFPPSPFVVLPFLLLCNKHTIQSFQSYSKTSAWDRRWKPLIYIYIIYAK